MTVLRNSVACLLVTLLLTGCGKSGPELPALVPVSGTVTWDGQPLVGGSVTLIPVSGTPGSGGTGRTNIDGKYELTDVTRNEVGVPAGSYKVVIMTPLLDEGYTPEPNAPPFTKVEIPPRYGHREQTKLTAEVAAGSGPINFDLKSKE